MLSWSRPRYDTIIFVRLQIEQWLSDCFANRKKYWSTINLQSTYHQPTEWEFDLLIQTFTTATYTFTKTSIWLTWPLPHWCRVNLDLMRTYTRNKWINIKQALSVQKITIYSSDKRTKQRVSSNFYQQIYQNSVDNLL